MRIKTGSSLAVREAAAAAPPGGASLRTRARGKGSLALAVAIALGAVLGLSAASAAGLTFVVNSTVDSVDANVGDGLCRTSAGTCTLRAATQEANAQPGHDTIHILPGTYAIRVNTLRPTRSS